MSRFAFFIIIFLGIYYSYLTANSSHIQDSSSLEYKNSTDQHSSSKIPLQVHNELNDIAKEYWNKYSCEKGESRFFKNDFDDLDDSEKIYEIRNMRFKGNTYKPTASDKLNSIDTRGYLEAVGTVFRYYYDGKWTEWMDGPGRMLSVPVSKKNGKWEIEDNPRVIPIDCSSIPD